MDKLQANVAQQAQAAGDNDAQRAKMQADESDRHYNEAERIKQERLKQLRLETQAYLFKQMAEKDNKKNEEKELQNIQAQILERDTEEYNEIERETHFEEDAQLRAPQGDRRADRFEVETEGARNERGRSKNE